MNENLSNNVSTIAKYQKKEVFIFGDSHCTIFLGAESSQFKADVCGYAGASISGINDITSKLIYGDHITNIIKHRPLTHYSLLKLGQVDLEFIMYHKIYVKKEIFTFEEFCNTLICKYREFIYKLREINQNIVICSINLPAYSSNVDIRTYVKIIITDSAFTSDSMFDIPYLDSRLCDFSYKQLIENFVHFNNLLHDLAKEHNLLFFDTTDLFIDKKTGLLKDEFRNHTHHYQAY